ncbi:MAG: hypothetical protein GX446_03320 [Chthonomonadales bacterium]|nr:hypothetical protein [Chthonomonadales bacterium]
MATRETMADLIARLRSLIADPAGDGATFTDDELEAILDQRRTEHRYRELMPMATFMPDGGVRFLQYAALERRDWREGIAVGNGIGDWEEGAALYGPDMNQIEPATGDLRLGRWTFAEHQPAPVTIVGATYDLYAAAADALERWAARLKGDCDVRAGDFAMDRSDRIRHLLDLAATMRRRARPTTGLLTRSDAC